MIDSNFLTSVKIGVLCRKSCGDFFPVNLKNILA